MAERAEAKHTLFVGSMRAMNLWMRDHRISPHEGGRTVHLATNGPEHLRGVRGPIRIVFERGWIPGESVQAWAIDDAITLAKRANGEITEGTEYEETVG